MKPLLLAFVDVPQHLRILRTVTESLGTAVDGRLLTTLSAPFGNGLDGLRVERLAVSPPPSAGLRLLRLLGLGRRTVRALHAAIGQIGLDCTRSAALERREVRVLVFNDTGIPQRCLIDLAKRRGWMAVLVQDGLTEVQHRESGLGFRARSALTRRLLAPLGLGHYGSSPLGAGGADLILADGPPSAAFFRQRAPGSRVEVVGLIRPAAPPGASCDPARLLFWCVDFAGGLGRPDLHMQQLQWLRALDAALHDERLPITVDVRLHPGDAAYVGDFRTQLAQCQRLELIDPRQVPEPLAGALPLASASLQSAGILDALAAGVPSWFVSDGARALAPAWAPAALRCAGMSALVAQLRTAATGAEARLGLWHTQTKALAAVMHIPCDAGAIRRLLG